VYVTSDKMLHGFGSFPGSPWSLSTSKSTGLEPMPLSNQTCSSKVRGFCTCEGEEPRTLENRSDALPCHLASQETIPAAMLAGTRML